MSLADDLGDALDPARFAQERLGLVPDDWQKHALRWRGKRLLLNCSRQAGKSTFAAILALHQALYRPHALILLVSPSLRQSAELFRKVTEFRKQLPGRTTLAEDNRMSCRFENGARIISLPSSEATVRGFSGTDLIIEDEASRVSDDLYRAMRPMLAVSGGKMILMSTPFGKRGHFFDEWSEGGAGWERVRITASDCPRISAEFLDEERRSLGDWWFRQEYMCEFVENVDQLFNYEEVMGALTTDVPPLFPDLPNNPQRQPSEP